MTQDADSGFPKPWTREIFYSIKDGNWTDTNVWNTASGRVGLLPTANDDVYVRNTITLNTTVSQNCNNLYISGRLNKNQNLTLTVNNIFCDIGFLDLSSAQALILNISGNNSTINNSNFLSGAANCVITYIGGEGQPILNLSYSSLTISGTGIKYLNSNLTLTGNLSVSSYLECLYYNLTVTGTTQTAGTLSKLGSGNILFVGQLNSSTFNFTGNPDVELRGGCINLRGYSGTGTWSFTTNNQSISSNGFGCVLDAKVLIESGITLTTLGGQILTLNDSINGVDGTSKWIASTGTVIFGTQTSAQNSMTTGIWDFTTNANTIQYNGNYSATIPSYFTTFSSLTIGGTGTKTLGVNTTLNGNLSLAGAVTTVLECSTYNLTVNGTTTTGTVPGNYLGKNGAGNILFVGAVLLGNSGTGFIFSGNPNVEFRGGLTTTNNNTLTNTGTGQWKFTTNSQTIQSTGGNFTNMNASILISGAITLNMSLNSSMNINSTIDGDNALSSLVLGNANTTIVFTNIAYYLPMATFGTINPNAGNISYNFNGNITIPYSTYGGLIINGTGTKTLGSNTTVLLNLTYNGVAGSTFECSTYNLTVNGTTNLIGTISTTNIFSKNGSGSLLFIGFINANGANLILSGNPTIECRGGFRMQNQSGAYNTGTGTITFSTNNQILDNSANNITYNNNIVISGAITVTVGSLFSSTTYIIKGTINGDNANSKLLMANSNIINYQNATQPMATGILDTSTNLNTWIYGLSNQDIKGNIVILTKQVYRNLTLNGGGTKTLLGFVSVLNTYTLTPPATVLLNGFTITNP